MSENEQNENSEEPVRAVKSLLNRAKKNDGEAITKMFRQFVMPEEKIFFAEFLGTEGIWGIGTHSFACLTDRRVATLRVGAFGEVIYQDGLLEYINSTVVFQPSKLGLYIMWFLIFVGYAYICLSCYLAVGITALAFALGFGGLFVVLLLIVSARIFYRLRKCGAVWWIREGVSVYAFSNRKRLVRINALSRKAIHLRDLLVTRAGLGAA